MNSLCHFSVIGARNLPALPEGSGPERLDFSEPQSTTKEGHVMSEKKYAMHALQESNDSAIIHHDLLLRNAQQFFEMGGIVIGRQYRK
jgi:hypothetical protein